MTEAPKGEQNPAYKPAERFLFKTNKINPGSISDHRRQPFFSFLAGQFFPCGIIIRLILLNAANREIFTFRMTEIPPAYRSAGVHRITFRQFYTGVLIVLRPLDASEIKRLRPLLPQPLRNLGVLKT